MHRLVVIVCTVLAATVACGGSSQTREAARPAVADPFDLCGDRWLPERRFVSATQLLHHWTHVTGRPLENWRNPPIGHWAHDESGQYGVFTLVIRDEACPPQRWDVDATATPAGAGGLTWHAMDQLDDAGCSVGNKWYGDTNVAIAWSAQPCTSGPTRQWTRLDRVMRAILERVAH